MENVAILGASPKTDRYSNKAQKMLTEYGHTVFPVSPIGGEIEGVKCYSSISEITTNIDTVTIYVSPDRLKGLISDIISIKPKRIIFNPGTEDTELIQMAKNAGITTVTGCTLVMLRTNQF